MNICSSLLIKNLSVGKKRISFRNNKGHALAHRGGGAKALYIVVDFKNIYWHMRGIVLYLKYDPNRSARLALVSYPNGVLNYTLASVGLHPGSFIYSGYDALFSIGSRFYLWQIPLGTFIFNIEKIKSAGGIYARAGGVYGVVLRKTQKYIVIRLPSKELKMFDLELLASIGQLANCSEKLKNKRKAGASRWLGLRPVVRGVAKNPVDHPHGGGEGKTSGGRPSVTPWGKITKGKPTRTKKKPSLKNILSFRNGLTNRNSFLYKK